MGLGVNPTAGGVAVGLGVTKVGDTNGGVTGERCKRKKSGESGVGGDKIQFKIIDIFRHGRWT